MPRGTAILADNERVEAGYATKQESGLASIGVYYPSTRHGCEQMARWCLAIAATYTDKYQVWKWQMDAAKWYKKAREWIDFEKKVTARLAREAESK